MVWVPLLIHALTSLHWCCTPLLVACKHRIMFVDCDCAWGTPMQQGDQSDTSLNIGILEFVHSSA